MDSDSEQVLTHTLDFTLSSGWALKERQRFGKKGGGKQISKHVIPYLEAYFLAGDVNKSEKYTAQEIYNKLKELAEEGILEEEEIPKVSTISNWITQYAQAHCKEKAQQALALVNSRGGISSVRFSSVQFINRRFRQQTEPTAVCYLVQTAVCIFNHQINVDDAFGAAIGNPIIKSARLYDGLSWVIKITDFSLNVFKIY